MLYNLVQEDTNGLKNYIVYFIIIKLIIFPIIFMIYWHP